MLKKRSYFPLTHSDIRGIIHTFYQVFFKKHEQLCALIIVSEGMDCIEIETEILYQENGKDPR